MPDTNLLHMDPNREEIRYLILKILYEHFQYDPKTGLDFLTIRNAIKDLTKKGAYSTPPEFIEANIQYLSEKGLIKSQEYDFGDSEYYILASGIDKHEKSHEHDKEEFEMVSARETRFYQVTIKYKERDEFAYAYEVNLTIEQAVEILADIMARKPTIMFDARTIIPKRVNEHRIFLTERPYRRSSQDLHVLFPRGYQGNYGGKEVTREIISHIKDRVIAQNKGKSIANGKVIVFLSASFDDQIDVMISWFIKMIEALDMEVIWLKEKYQARPVEEKIKENIASCNGFIQIITGDVYEEGREAGWMGNEIAWARDSTPNGNMAIFVENGVKATGLARVVADNLYFDPDALSKEAPRIIQYLHDLRNKILS